jgi:hypothetical protein
VMNTNIPYFPIDKARVICEKSLNSLEMNMLVVRVHLKCMIGKSNVRSKHYLIFIEH